jgi:hypothetical protein
MIAIGLRLLILVKEMMMSETSQIENVLNAAAGVGAAVGGPVGQAVAAGLQVGEAVVNAVQTSQSAHADALTTATEAAGALATAAQPVLATLPANDAAKAQASLGLLQTVLADLKSIFGL